MLVTNRNIVQNVVERLRGINRTSAFRTASVDGHELKHRLADHPEVVQKYFGEAKTVVRKLGQPIITSQLHDSQYIVEIQVKTKPEHSPVTLRALLDTGSELSVLPRIVADNFGVTEYFVQHIEYATGESLEAQSCFVYLRFPTGEWLNSQALILDTDTAVVGRDFLQHFTLLIDATKGIAKLWPEI